MKTLRAAPLVVLPLLLAACDPPPVPVEEARPPRPSRGMPEGHPRIDEGGQEVAGGLPAGHPPLGGAARPDAAAASVRFAGEVRLEGELAETEDGTVFVSIMPEGIRMPSFTRRYPLSRAAAKGDARVLAFELTEAHLLAGLSPGAQHVAEASFSPSGMVEDLRTRSAQVLVAPGAEGVVLVLGGE